MKGAFKADGLEGRAEFVAPVYAGGKINIDKKNDGELAIIDGDPEQLHFPCFGTEELHFGADLFAEVKRTLAVLGQSMPWSTVESRPLIW